MNASGSFDVDFAAFSARFAMPSARSRGFLNHWFSYDFRNVHYISVSSEHPHDASSPQWQWADADLAAVDRAATPWIVFTQHRPIYSSDASEPGLPGGDYSAAWEPLLKKYAVDLVIVGHQHMFERTFPVLNGTVVSSPDANNTFTNPGAPIYIVVGTAGANQEEKYLEPQPAWSAVRFQEYGYGQMTVTGGASLAFDFVDIYGEVRDSFTIARMA